MALIVSNGTGGGLASLTTSWLGGVVPVLGDSVQIDVTDTIQIDGVYNWGDGTTTALVVFGTVEMSPTVNSGILLNGDATLKTNSWLKASMLQTAEVSATSVTTIAREVWNTVLPLTDLANLYPSLTLYPSTTLYPQGA